MHHCDKPYGCMVNEAPQVTCAAPPEAAAVAMEEFCHCWTCWSTRAMAAEVFSAAAAYLVGRGP
jgi:hypothetical protein